MLVKQPALLNTDISPIFSVQKSDNSKESSSFSSKRSSNQTVFEDFDDGAAGEDDTTVPGSFPTVLQANSSNNYKLSKDQIKDAFLKTLKMKPSRTGENITTVYLPARPSLGGEDKRLGYLHDIDTIIDYLLANSSKISSPQFSSSQKQGFKNKVLTNALVHYITDNFLKGDISSVEKTHPILHGRASKILSLNQSGKGKIGKIKIYFSKWNKTLPF